MLLLCQFRQIMRLMNNISFKTYYSYFIFIIKFKFKYLYQHIIKRKFRHQHFIIYLINLYPLYPFHFYIQLIILSKFITLKQNQITYLSLTKHNNL
jgi:hypothetical protein